MINFDNKVALVTGAGRGLGRSHAETLAKLGASVLVSDVDADVAEEVAAGIKAAGGKAAAKQGDVSKDEDAKAIVQAAVDAFGQLDIVVNNAGVDKHDDFGPGVMEQTRRHMDINFLGTVAVTAAAWPHLVKSGNGRVVSTSSPTVSGWEGETPYVASKAAIFGWTRSLSIEALKQGIRVNAIAPTAYTRMAEAADIPQELKDTLKANMTTAMVSAMVAYLASDECGVAGEILLTQGGLMQRFSLAMNEGYANPECTPDDIKEHLDQILDDSTAKPLGGIGTENETSLLDIV